MKNHNFRHHIFNTTQVKIFIFILLCVTTITTIFGYTYYLDRRVLFNEDIKVLADLTSYKISFCVSNIYFNHNKTKLNNLKELLVTEMKNIKITGIFIFEKNDLLYGLYRSENKLESIIERKQEIGRFDDIIFNNLHNKNGIYVDNDYLVSVYSGDDDILVKVLIDKQQFSQYVDHILFNFTIFVIVFIFVVCFSIYFLIYLYVFHPILMLTKEIKRKNKFSSLDTIDKKYNYEVDELVSALNDFILNILNSDLIKNYKEREYKKCVYNFELILSILNKYIEDKNLNDSDLNIVKRILKDLYNGNY